MTHPLSEELRKLADDYVDSPFVDALRRAAEGLDLAQDAWHHWEGEAAIFKHERDELRRRMRFEETEKWIDLYTKSEAQAARYKAAIEAFLHSEEHEGPLRAYIGVRELREALREPETGGKT